MLQSPAWPIRLSGRASRRQASQSRGRRQRAHAVNSRSRHDGAPDTMGAVGRHREIAAGKLVRALGTGLDPRELVLNGIVDGSIVAKLEMQTRVLFERTPISAIEPIGADEVECSGDGPALAPGENEKDLVAHGLADQAEEGARQIGRAPFARTRVHIKGEERVPMRLGEVGARHPIYLDAILQRASPLAAYGLSLSGGKCAEEIVEALIAVVAPVELLIVALQEAKPAGKLPLLLCGKSDV